MWDYALYITSVFSIVYICFQKISRRPGSVNRQDSHGKSKALFITGCDSGFGYSLIHHHLEKHDRNDIKILIAGCYFPGGTSEGKFVKNSKSVN